jgi:hypothetical protein
MNIYVINNNHNYSSHSESSSSLFLFFFGLSYAFLMDLIIIYPNFYDLNFFNLLSFFKLALKNCDIKFFVIFLFNFTNYWVFGL